MSNSKFVYVTYIRTTPEKLWEALTNPEFIRQYWFGARQESEWRVGSSWKAFAPDGEMWDSGEILQVDRPRRLVLSWLHEHFPDMHAEGSSRLTYDLEPTGTMVKFTLTHEIDVVGSKLIEGVSNGWPMILASLKSLLETGQPLEETKTWPK
jgi:uncharacterized protein YndB with AHSA1/START domain